MPIPKKMVLVIAVLMAFTINITNNQALELVDGKKYYYAVVCTDYCGSKTWDATYLDADIFIEYQGSNNDIISFYSHYNSTTLINRSYSNDYGVFNLTEHYTIYSRKNNRTGSPAWQWIGDSFPNEINVTIPYFFLAHAPQAFTTNIHNLVKIEQKYLIKLSNGRTVTTYEYSGEWKYEYRESNLTITVISDLKAFYDVESGLIIRMNLEMNAYHEQDELFLKEPVIDAVGSFKMTYVEPRSAYQSIFPTVVIPSLIIYVLIKKLG
ncbi:MAG: hypothetical protein ACTSR2_01715 [Candidatus Hodarchaeales archaeon]